MGYAKVQYNWTLKVLTTNALTQQAPHYPKDNVYILEEQHFNQQEEFYVQSTVAGLSRFDPVYPIAA